MEQKISIGLFVDNFSVIDGVMTVVRQYATLLGDRADVFVVCPKNRKQEFHEQFEMTPCRSVHFPIIGYDVAFPSFDRAFRKILKERKIDIIHIHSPFTVGIFALRLARKKGIPVVATFHSQFKQDFEFVFKTKLMATLALKKIVAVFNACDEVWPVNVGCERLLREYGYRGRTFVIENATEMCPVEDPEAAAREVNERFGLLPEDRVLLFLGRITRLKGVLFIEEVLCHLRDRGMDFKFLFVGDGAASPELKKRIALHALSDRVILTGTVKDRELIAKIYSRASLFVFPSYYDADCIVKYEAAAQGTPTVFAEGAITVGAVKDKETGYIAENDPLAFAGKIEEIFADEDTYRTVCENVKTKLYRHWNRAVDTAYERYLYLIEEKKKGKE